jgi:hypothetical protein
MLLTMESKTAAYHKLETLIERGRTTASNVVDYVMNNQPNDRLAQAGQMDFQLDSDSGQLLVSYPDQYATSGRLVQRLHRNALSQIADTANLSMKFVDSLQNGTGRWGTELLAHNLNMIFRNRFSKQRHLLRSLGQEVRGFLSNKYRRLDSRPIVEAFATAVQKKGAMPYNGYVTDTKIAIQAIMPEVYEPIPGELVAYGISLENSDFGNGALSLRAYLLRIWCSNLAITEEEMRQIHLGKRLDESMLYSNRTYELDAKATVSALRDVIESTFDSDSLKRRMDSIREANEQALEPQQAKETLRRLLQKGELDAAAQAFESQDTYNLPAGNTKWRLSNAISWIAGQTKDEERKLDLMKIAGEVLPSSALRYKSKSQAA